MSTTATPTAAANVRRLQRYIVAIRRKRSVVKSATGIALAISVLVGIVIAESLLDRLVNLPWIARAVVLLGCLAGVGYLLWRESIKPLRDRLDDDAVALLIEHALPEFRTRFIASIQLARSAGAKTSSLVGALLAETAVMAKSADFRQVVKTARLKRILKSCTGIVVVACTLLFFGGEAGVLLLKRAMLFNVALPGWTHILSVSGAKNIGIGEDLKIDVIAGGVIPSQGRVIVTSSSGQKREFALAQDAKQNTNFSTVIHSPQESFSYVVKLGDATSLSYEVKAFKRPTVAEVACEQVYPAYVDMQPVQRQVSDLVLLVGSRLNVTVKASMKISKASLRLVGLDREIPMKIGPSRTGGDSSRTGQGNDPKDRSVLYGEIEIPAKDLTGFSIHLVSSDGIESGEGVVYRIDTVPDHEPTVTIVSPSRREEAATSQATSRIGFEAKDDFGISKAALHFSVEHGAEKTIDFDLGKRAQKSITRRFEWKLGSLQPHVEVGSAIEYWITVTDGNNVSGPGIGTTEHYQTKIVTDDEKRVDLANRLRETMSGVTELTESQQELNKNLGEPLFEKQKQSP